MGIEKNQIMTSWTQASSWRHFWCHTFYWPFCCLVCFLIIADTLVFLLCHSKIHLITNKCNFTLTLIWPIKNYHFFSYDLDLDPMTLILKHDLDMVTMYLHTKKWSFYVKVFKSYSLNRQKHRQTDTQTHKQTDMTEKITYLRTQVVKIGNINREL